MSKGARILLILFLVVGGAMSTNTGTAQSDDCGNGLTWQFQIGDIGKVEVNTLRVYDSPNGSPITRLSADDSFSVISGPECDTDGISWWQIRLTGTSTGWVFEGRNDEYIIGVASSERVESSVTTCVLDSAFEVGSFLQLSDNSDVVFYQGDPYRGSLVPAQSIYRFGSQSNNQLLIVEGPVCWEGTTVWRIYSGRAGSLWVSELNERHIRLDGSTTKEPVTFDPQVIALRRTVNVPILDPRQQLSYIPGGGGGPTLDRVHCIIGEAGEVYFQHLTIMPKMDNYNPRMSLPEICIERFVPSHIDEVEIVIRQPDGIVYDQFMIATDRAKVGEIGRGVRFAIPDSVGLQQGIWHAYITHPEIDQIHIAYSLSVFSEEPIVMTYCDGFEERIMIFGLEPLREYELVLAKSADLAGGDQVHDEIVHWNLTSDTSGVIYAQPKFLLEPGDYVVTISEFLNRRMPFYQVQEYPKGCPTPTLATEALAEPIEYGDYVTGNHPEISDGFYAFEGRQGDVITIELVALDDDVDPSVQLYMPDGTKIAENDNAAVEEHGPFSSKLDAFELPVSGTYIIAVRTKGHRSESSFMLHLSD